MEKLCQRFRLSDDPRQWRDIAFCLSLLPFKSERSVKKLIEGLQFYRDKLHEPTVFERFTEILTKVRLLKFLSNQHVIQPIHRREVISRRINLIRSWMNLKRYASCYSSSNLPCNTHASLRFWKSIRTRAKKTRHYKTWSRSERPPQRNETREKACLY